MAYEGSVELISGITPKNGQNFPLVDAKDVRVDDDTRLSDALDNLQGSFVRYDDSQTLTENQKQTARSNVGAASAADLEALAAVRYDSAQNLTTAQKQIARSNIGAVELASDLTETGKAADSKLVGDELTDLKDDLSELVETKHGLNIVPPIFEDGFITSTGAMSNPGNAFRSKDFIPVTGGADIITMNQLDLSLLQVAIYDNNKVFTERVSVYTDSKYTLPVTAAYIKVTNNVFDAATALTKKIGLAYADTVTNYTDYQTTFQLSEDVVIPDYLETRLNTIETDIENLENNPSSIEEIANKVSINIVPPIFEDGFITSTGAMSNPGTAFRSKDFIPVTGGADIIFMTIDGLSAIYVAQYDTNKDFISRFNLSYNSAVTLNSSANYIKVASNNYDAEHAQNIGIAYSDEPVVYSTFSEYWKLNDDVELPSKYGDYFANLHSHNKIRWCAMGDSITEGTYSDANGAHVVPSETWVALVTELCKYKTTNKGIGGTGWVKKGSQGDKKNAREQVDDIDFSAYDLVTLSFGINDWKGGVSWGTMADSPTLGGTVYSNMKYVIEKIISDNPYAKVIVITPFNCRQGKGELATEATNYAIGYDYDGHTLQDMFDLEVEICKYYGIQYLDMTHTSIINRKNIVNATPDYVHPSIDAHVRIAYQTANSLNYNN